VGTSSVPEENPAKQISRATWGRIAADIERLALTNQHLTRSLEELERSCLDAFNENERMKRILRDHNIPLEAQPP
jgi:hypothetical protein